MTELGFCVEIPSADLGSMSAAELLAEAKARGLRVTAEGDRLSIRGPKSADAFARMLLGRKTEVLPILAAAPTPAPAASLFAMRTPSTTSMPPAPAAVIADPDQVAAATAILDQAAADLDALFASTAWQIAWTDRLARSRHGMTLDNVRSEALTYLGVAREQQRPGDVADARKAAAEVLAIARGDQWERPSWLARHPTGETP